MPNEEMGSRDMPQSPDVATAIVLTTVAGFLSFVALSMAGLFFYLRHDSPGAFKPAVEHQFPEPRLQKQPQYDLRRFDSEQHMVLSGYGWTDRSKDLARIPIDQAMRIIAARGDHAYDAPDPAAGGSNAGDPSGSRP